MYLKKWCCCWIQSLADYKQLRQEETLPRWTSTPHLRHFTPRPKRARVSPLWQARQDHLGQSKQTQEVFPPKGHHTHKQLTQLCECLPVVSAQCPTITGQLLLIYLCVFAVFTYCAVYTTTSIFNLLSHCKFIHYLFRCSLKPFTDQPQHNCLHKHHLCLVICSLFCSFYF